jgi:hypothetical protein
MEPNNREELRRRLREKIHGKRNNTCQQEMASRMKKDPQTALMSLGVDDAQLLQQANMITKSPHAFLQTMLQEVEKTQREESSKENPQIEEDDDDEEAPPS